MVRAPFRPWTTSLLLLPLLTACGSDPIPPTTSVASVIVQPDTELLTSVGETVQLRATIRDADGNVVSDVSVAWASSDAAVEVSPSGLATARANGGAVVTATAAGVSGSADVTVEQVAVGLSVSPGSGFITALGETESLVATAVDARDNPVEDVAVEWLSDAPGVAEVDELGVVTAAGVGVAVITATAGAVSADAVIEVDTWQSLSSATYYACGTLSSGRLYCWGDPARAFETLSPDPSTAPALVDGVTLASVVAGGDHACGLDRAGRAYCWGDNTWGQLGDGGFLGRGSPAEVAGGHSFVEIRVMNPVGVDGAHTCALKADGSAWCWGLAERGRLGVGPDIETLTPCGDSFCATEPTAVEGGLNYTTMALGAGSTCALEEGTGDGYCWGGGPAYMTPQQSSWAPAFASIASHFQHTCGVDAGGAGFCWGAGVAGKLGNGSTTSQPTPASVEGGYSFSAISAGVQHTCGIADGGNAYCWGLNRGKLGRGDTDNDYVAVPSSVLGELSFTTISATGQSCGITMDGAAYCWGENFDGQLGDGTEIDRGVPTRVLDPEVW